MYNAWNVYISTKLGLKHLWRITYGLLTLTKANWTLNGRQKDLHTGSCRFRDTDQIIYDQAEIPSDYGPRTEIPLRDYGPGGPGGP